MRHTKVQSYARSVDVSDSVHANWKIETYRNGSEMTKKRILKKLTSVRVRDADVHIYQFGIPIGSGSFLFAFGKIGQICMLSIGGFLFFREFFSILFMLTIRWCSDATLHVISSLALIHI